MSILEKPKSQASVYKYTDTVEMETEETYRTYVVIL